MFKIQNGRLYPDMEPMCLSFKIPEGFWLDSDPLTLSDNQLTIWTPEKDARVEVRIGEKMADTTEEELQKFFFASDAEFYNDENESDARESNSTREIPKLDLDEYGINHELVYWKTKGVLRYIWRALILFSEHNPFDKYANFTNCFIRWGFSSLIKKNLQSGFKPDVVILQWTQIVLMASKIKKIYPDAKIIAIEEDVSFLSYERKMNASHGIIRRKLWKHKYDKLRKIELNALAMADLVINNNKKDEALLKETNCGINTWVWCPYFQSMIDVKRGEINKDILFYGAMEREENWKSAIWFIDNVFYRIEDQSVRFIIAGNRPNEELKKYANERVKVLGFVEDVTPLFEHSLCLVAPLVLGAGVKIKVLEGLSSGIPVLTNKIGIEGIPAKDKIEYFYCQSPDEYLSVINMLLQNTDISIAIENNAKDFIRNNYDYNIDSMKFAERIIPDLLDN